MEHILRRLGMNSCFSVDSQGASGGLALMWQHYINLEILHSNRHYMDSLVRLDNGTEFHLTSVYGDLLKRKENSFGVRLRYWDKEKEGGNRPTARDVTHFRNMVESCELIDLPTHGPQFTWSNKRHGCANIRIKLDRALANHAWRSTFPNTAVTIRATLNSDHCPLIIVTEGGKFQGQRPLRFESIWFRHPEYKDTALKAWAPVAVTDDTPILFKKMHKCKPIFRRWNREVFGRVQTKILNLKGELEELQGGPVFDGYQVKEQELSLLLNEELEKEEELWRQKSRVSWLQQGIDQEALHLVLESIQPQVTQEMNLALCAIPTLQEVQAALDNMAPLKAPGPDGLPPAFFQKFWDFTHSDVYDFVRNFFISVSLRWDCNETFLCLVPKCTNPETADQYKPISLCAVAVKIISRIMANRLKDALEILMSPVQSAFIPGRSISDYIFVAHEVFNYINKKKKGKHKYLALKLDMRKAYDRVEWDFIEQLLLRFGFADHWVNLALSGVVSSAEVSGLVRGIRVHMRTAPISHLLFADDCFLFSQVKVDEAGRHFNGWKNRLLSHAGKETLLKSVGFSLANYAASHFKLPATHHNQIRKEAAKFFWGDGSDKSKIQWISWLCLCQSKERGGLGFCDPSLHNKALLAKVAWKMWKDLGSYWAKFLKAIYFPNCEFMEARLGANPSWAWRSIMEGQQVLQAGLLWRVGSGEMVDIWNDNWLPTHVNFKLLHPLLEDCPYNRVSQLIDFDNRKWNESIIDRYVHPEDRKDIYQLQLSLFATEDRQVWGPSKVGTFSVKSAYHFLCNQWTTEELGRASSSTSH
ncbi:uncharacterized protein LOC122649220 [Telopea speciosissima]|uniref:uncharacterized protein LOC122649220 n=1 Tax=Telopea speciosissima TaxID=54955 RepID=UPI001CC43DE8|nr:uncharacterized protein LOC122649220 [Telopea speciosissima]